MSNFWLDQWIDEFEIRSMEDAKRALKRRSRGLPRAQEIAASVAYPEPVRDFSSGSSFVAGRGIDLSGDLDCCHHVCQISQVQSLFGRALHYFDEIVVAGPSPYRFSQGLSERHKGTIENLIEHVGALLHLRKIGVRDMLTFTQKPPACQEHFMQHAHEVGISEAIEQAHSWVDRLEREGVVRHVEHHDDHAHYQFEHQDLEHTAWGTVGHPNPSTRDIAEAVFRVYAAHLVSDVAAARAIGLPLAAQVQLHESVLTGKQAIVSAEDVAISLRIPVLDQLPVRDIVRLRHDEWDSFERFRNSLKEAIQERIENNKSGAEIADEVLTDVITPALNDISQKLRLTERTLGRKLGTAATFGTVGITVGLLGGIPLVVGGGIAATVTSLPAIQKYFDDRSAVELSDMYFLWQLEGKAHQRH